VDEASVWHSWSRDVPVLVSNCQIPEGGDRTISSNREAVHMIMRKQDRTCIVDKIMMILFFSFFLCESGVAGLINVVGSEP